MPHARSPNRTPVILAAEDSLDDQMLISIAAERVGMPVDLHFVNDGREALRHLRGDGDTPPGPRPDLVLLDLNMPVLSGMQLLEHLRDDADLRRIPVLILSTSNSSREIDACYQLGCNAYIVKPYDLNRFERVFADLLRFWCDTVALPCKPRPAA